MLHVRDVLVCVASRAKQENTARDYEIQPSPGRSVRKNDVAPKEDTRTRLQRGSYVPPVTLLSPLIRP